MQNTGTNWPGQPSAEQRESSAGQKRQGKKLKEAIDAGHGEESDPSYTGELMGWMCSAVERSASEMSGSVPIRMYSGIMPMIRLMHLPDRPATVRYMISSR